MTKKSAKPSVKKIKQKIIHTQSSDHQYHYAHGALVGTSPRMDIVIQLYKEKNPLPSSWTREIDEEGNVTEPGIQHNKEEIERIFSATIFMNPGTAYSMGKLLTEKAEYIRDQLEKMTIEEAKKENE